MDLHDSVVAGRFVTEAGHGRARGHGSSAAKHQGLTAVAVPVPGLIVFLVLAALSGLVAATRPARRAARLDVLAAIASQ